MKFFLILLLSFEVTAIAQTTTPAPPAAKPSAAPAPQVEKKPKYSKKAMADYLAGVEKERLHETRQACGVELLKYCRKEKSKMVTARVCLSNNQSKITGPCKVHVAEYTKAYIEEFKKWCGEAKEKYCPGLKGPPLIACLKKRKDISFECNVMLY